MTLSVALLVASLTVVSAETPSVSQKTENQCTVLTPDGKPAPGARVWIACSPGFYTGDGAQDRLLASGRSDAQGQFHAAVEWPDDVEHRYGTIIASLPDASLVGGASFSSRGRGLAAPVASAQVKLSPTAECRMRLLKPDGSPAKGVKVWVESCTMPGDKPGFMYINAFEPPRLREVGWEATTDAEGRCVIPRLPRDASLYVMHDAAGLAQMPDKHMGKSKVRPRVNGVESTHQLAAAGSLRGRLKLPDGSPCKGGFVYLLEMTPYTTSYGTQLPVNADGSFVISHIPPSSYKLSYRALLSDQDRWIGDEKPSIPVKAGETTDVGELALAPVAIVTAKVLDAESGEEIEQPVIFRLKAGTHVLNYRTKRVGPPTHMAAVDKGGIPVHVAEGERKSVAFRLSRRPPGQSVTVTVLNSKGEPATHAVVALLGQGHERFVFPGPVDAKGVIRFEVNKPKGNLTAIAWDANSVSEPAAAMLGGSVTLRLQDSGFSTVRGQIRDEEGRPIAGADFSLQHDLYALDELVDGPFQRHVTVEEDGRFEVTRIPRVIKEVSMHASSEGRASASLPDLVLKPGEVFEWNPVLKAANEVVAGVVVDKAGAPVPGATVRVSGDAQPRSSRKPVVTDAEGRFRFEHQAAGQAYVEASQKTESLSRRISASIKVPKEDVRLMLPDATGRAAGVVVDHRGQPAPRAELRSFSRDRKITADAQGRFVFTGIEKGWFTAEVTYRNADGKGVQHRFRLKTGDENSRVQLPAETEDYAPLPLEPVNLIGKPAPEIHVETWMNTEPLATKAGGKVRILDFWGMECSPCIATFPKVAKFWKDHQKDGIEFIALGSDFYPEREVREFLKLHPDYTFPIALQPETASDGRDYDVRGVPTYVVIGKDGLILSKGHDWGEASAVALKAAGKGSEEGSK
jgi:thiol-disulfide isomerase/thioredoxin